MPYDTLGEAAQVAAKWWCDLVYGPVENCCKIDKGPSMIEGFMRLSRQPPNPELRPALEQAIVDLCLQEKTIEKYGLWLSVDYDPDRILRQAAERAGLRLYTGTFPIKSSTYIFFKDEKWHVKAYNGYGAEAVIL